MTKEQRLTAREFLQEITQTQTRGQLGVISLVAAFSVVAAIAAGMSLAPGWPGAVAAAGIVALDAGVWWWVLGVGRVQRWIRDGS